jgi:hypothetical protein
MDRRKLLRSVPTLALLPAAIWAASDPESAEAARAKTTVYELRVYHANEGKLDDLIKRFRDHTRTLFERHGMKNVAYWTPVDNPLKGKTLIYILAHPSREAAAANWKAFQADPDWVKVRDASEVNGKLVDHEDSTYMVLTDFSKAI